MKFFLWLFECEVVLALPSNIAVKKLHWRFLMNDQNTVYFNKECIGTLLEICPISSIVIPPFRPTSNCAKAS